jgi:hypothetical protein
MHSPLLAVSFLSYSEPPLDIELFKFSVKKQNKPSKSQNYIQQKVENVVSFPQLSIT